MKLGKIISVGEERPKRNVEIRITSESLLSAISDPPGEIAASDVSGFDVVEKKSLRGLLYHLYLRLNHGDTVLFYSTKTQFDIALILDELEASLGDKPRTWTKAEHPNRDVFSKAADGL